MTFTRFGAWLAAASLAASCTIPPGGSAPSTSTLSLSLAGLYPAERQIQYLPAGTRAKVTVSGPGLDQPLTMTVPISGNTVTATLSGIPIGPNRLITFESLDDAGAVLKGSRYRTTATLREGSNSAVISPATTPRGDVLAKLFADGISWAATLDADKLQAKIEGIQRAQRVPHFGLIDGETIADALKANGGNVSALSESEAAFVQQAATLTVTIKGLPSNLPAEVWMSDPVSPKQSGLSNGNVAIAPIKPGTWNLHGRAGSLRVGPFAITVPAASDAPVVLDFAEAHVQSTMPMARAAAAAGLMTVSGIGESLVMAGGQVTIPSPITLPALATDSVVAHHGESWTTLAPMPSAVSHAGYASHVGKLFVVGGRNPLAQVLSSVYAYDAAEDAWDASLPDLPEERIMSVASVLGNHLYVLGGNPELSLDDWIIRLPLTGEDRDWEPVQTDANPLRPRMTFGGASAVVGGKWLIVSGMIFQYGRSNLTHEVLLFDPETGSIRSVAPIPTARLGASAWVENGKVFVAGGTDVRGHGLTNVEVYDPGSNTWSARPTLRKGRGFAAFSRLNGKAIFAGGHDGHIFDEDVVPLDVLESFAF